MNKIFLTNLLLFTILSFSMAQLDDNGPTEMENFLPSTEVSFVDLSEALSETSFSGGIVVGIADMDGDKLDDIIRLEGGNSLSIEYQKTGRDFLNYTYGDVSTVDQWSISIADVDDNGFNDILLGGKNDGAKILLANDDGSEYSPIVLPQSSFFIQGSNLVDINQDGLLDVFICDDDNESKIWENTGDGNFINADDWIDMSTVPVSDNSGNYSSLWTDFDNDGDLDLHISKCRADTTADENDPRRINQLFVNDGNNNFTEMAEIYGLKNGAQTWTADFQDIDNDGDLDAFVANHYTVSQLLLNDGTGHYTDITATSGLDITNVPLQAMFRDFDNDGFVDLLVAGQNGYLFYENNGNLSFSEVTGIFQTPNMGTYGVGDLNHDGFLDVFSGSPGSNDKLWINEKNENNFFAVNLSSDFSNRNAVGARLELYGSWGIQIREVRAGESYGIMNSYTKNFGLGSATSIDSLLVRWPSGNVEVFENPQVNQFLNIVENECAYPDCQISANGSTINCSGDTLILTAPLGENYLWSTGATSPNILALEEGFYVVTVTNSYGCTSVSDSIEITQDPIEDVEIEIVTVGATTFCQGSSVQLFASSPSGNNFVWSTGQISISIFAVESGEYTVTTNGFCQEVTSDPLTVEVIPLPENPMVENDTILEMNLPESVILMATGDNLIWYDAPVGGTELETGNSYQTPELTMTTSFYVQDFVMVDMTTCESDRVEVMVVVDSIDAVPVPIEKGFFSVYPNPVSDYFIIKNENLEEEEVILQIYDSSGKLIYMEMLENFTGEAIIMTKNLNSGFYTLSISNTEDVFIDKLVVKKD